MTTEQRDNADYESALEDIALNLFRGAVKMLLVVVPKEKLVELARRLWKKFWDRKLDDTFDTRIGIRFGDKIGSVISDKIAEDVDEYLSNL